MKTAKDIDEYIAGFPKDVQKILNQVRATIKKAAPDSEEMISYAIPGFRLNKMNLVYFAGYKKHISIYPAPVKTEAFKKAFANYKTGKGTVQFPLDQPMPLTLITKIVRFRIKANAEKSKKKKA